MHNMMLASYRRLAAQLALAVVGLMGCEILASAQERPIRPLIQVDFGGAYLGIQMEDVTAANMASYKLTSERGVIVREVQKGSPAEDAKLQENDVILEYEGMQVLSSMQLARMVRETPPGRHVDLTISRAGKKLPITVKLSEREGGSWEGRRMEIPMPGPNFGFMRPDDGGRPFPIPANQARLGITVQPLTDQLASFLGVPGKKGALVASVMEGQPAFNKLKAGDVIIRAADQAVDSPDDLIRIVREKDGGRIDLKVIREKKELAVTVEMPAKGESAPKRGYRL